ncbi:Hypothetical predicted protein [Pelobates cultripes]|uniref:Uncharacterized protein n=1 Tax=Pelobates cultripes TaxID=61616 RepID=A0AAD1SW65_PELCU|nr:Hypothetical predicted protein [Pelobates cultripes]
MLPRLLERKNLPSNLRPSNRSRKTYSFCTHFPTGPRVTATRPSHETHKMPYRPPNMAMHDFPGPPRRQEHQGHPQSPIYLHLQRPGKRVLAQIPKALSKHPRGEISTMEDPSKPGATAFTPNLWNDIETLIMGDGAGDLGSSRPPPAPFTRLGGGRAATGPDTG